MTPKPNQQLAVRNPFGDAPATQHASAAALAQREVGEVQAAMVIAQRFPRDPRAAMDRILAACSREGLAAESSYDYARGGSQITGPSIRLAEELARSWGNMLSGVAELSRADGISECLAYAWDLETNYRDEKRFHVRHWRDTRAGGYALTDERDIYETIANSGARRKRACILAIVPTDVQDAAVQQCEETLKAKVNITPERIKSLVERFAEVGVTLEQIEARMQRRIDTITPALMISLGRIYTSLKDGMSGPEQWFKGAEEKPAAKKRPIFRGKKEEPEVIDVSSAGMEAAALVLEGQTEDELAATQAEEDKLWGAADQDGHAA